MRTVTALLLALFLAVAAVATAAPASADVADGWKPEGPPIRTWRPEGPPIREWYLPT
jgi:hypothetical protein